MMESDNDDDSTRSDSPSASQDSSALRKNLPLLPLRDIVVFPHMVVPLFVGRDKSILALEDAVENSCDLLLSAQKESGKDDPGAEDVYRVGTIGSVIQLLRLSDGTVKVLVEGKSRARIDSFERTEPFFSCVAEELPEDESSTVEVEALMRSIQNSFESYVKLNKKVPPEMLNKISTIDSPGRMADALVAHLNLKIDKRQRLLEMTSGAERLEEVYALMQSEMEVMEVERKIRSRVK